MLAERRAPSRHKCLIYDGDATTQLAVVMPLLRESLAENWRCLYLGSPPMVSMIDDALGTAGIDATREMQRGALRLSSDRSHLVDGVFRPDTMIDALCAEIDDAVGAGFEGLCATGDMRWELGDDANFAHLLAYEARLEEVFRTKPLRGVCQYHRSLVPASAVRTALVTHRSAYIGETLNQDNLFYLPPELVIDGDDAAGEWMCQQILRVLNAERTRDHALTELRASEAHQRALATELAALNRQLERRVAERTADLTTANEALAAFSYSVSHDLRAPLRAVRSFSDALQREHGHTLPNEGRQHLDRVCRAARQMDDLIEGMLTLARVSHTDLVRQPVNLTALAHEIIRDLRDTTPERAITVVIHPDLRTVGDRTLIRAALQNLLSNAWKFTGHHPAPQIEVGTLDGADGQTFFVRDNGAGFDPAYADRLFGVFQRLHSDTEFGGTGVGLATVHRIITRHGGRVWAESARGRGATFFFTVPVTQ